jgi:hypothetical protein
MSFIAQDFYHGWARMNTDFHARIQHGFKSRVSVSLHRFSPIHVHPWLAPGANFLLAAGAMN